MLKNNKTMVDNCKKILRAKQNRLMLLSNCTICAKKKSQFTKNQEPSGLLNKFGYRTPLTFR